MSTRLIIITVGTSLLNNNGGKKRVADKEASVTELNRICDEALDSLEDQQKGGDVSDLWQAIQRKAAQVHAKLERFVETEGAVNKELDHRDTPQNRLERDRLPQELSYLALLAGKKRETGEPALPETGVRVPVALLASDSPSGRLCAEVVRLVLSNKERGKPWDRFELVDEKMDRVVEGLRVEAPPRGDPETKVSSVFRYHGVPALIRQFQELSKGWNQVTINLTGGFKGAIPYSTIAAAFLEPDQQVDMHYLFEETREIISLPVYPIGLDFPLWHHQAVMLHADELLGEDEQDRAGEQYRRVYYENLHPRMQGVADEIRRAQKIEGRAVLPDLLKKRYEDQLNTDPFQVYSEHVIQHLLREEDERDLKDRLVQLIRHIGPHIWLGDKLPMAADHAHLHHHDLLEITQLLLTPIADWPVSRPGDDKRFLNRAERFVLLAAVLLHDCGHTIDALPLAGEGDKRAEQRLVPLFRTEIRNLHQFLAYHRMTQLELARPLGWDPSASYAKAAAWLCIYHRRRTGWDGVNDKREAGKVGHDHCAYRDIPARYPVIPLPVDLTRKQLRLKAGEDFDFPKLVALLRLIDGCDNQGRRVGPWPYRQMTEKILTQDAQTWKARLVQLLPAALQAGEAAGDVASKAMPFLDQVRRWCDEKSESEEPAPEQDGSFWELRQQLGKEVAFNPEPWKSLWLEVARCLDEHQLRDAQTVHFAKHEVVKRVTLLPVGDFRKEGRWRFRVTLTKLEADTERRPDLYHNEEFILTSPAFARKHAKAMGRDDDKKPFPTLRAWVEHEITSELSDRMVAYLEEKANCPIQIAYRWDDEETPFKTIPRQ